jgi:YgiT-type zinc finger domain-containing protein
VKCHVCGSEMNMIETDLPFKVGETTIVIVQALPVFQCRNCEEYLMEDSVMRRVDQILEHANVHAELEIVRYAS